MNISFMMISGIIAMLAVWALGATHVFAPDLFAMLDVSDILSGIGMTVLAIGGNLASIKLF